MRKNNIKKIISVIGLLTLIQIVGLLQSCDLINPCGSDGPIIVNLNSIESSLIRITKKERSFQSSHTINLRINEFENYNVNEGYIRFDSVGIDISTLLYSYTPESSNGSIFNSAFACSPSVDYDAIADISITSSQDYNQWYGAGGKLNSMILIRTSYDSYGTLFSDYNIQTDYTLERYESMLLTFSMPPSISNSFDFTIKITTDKGEVFTEEINGLNISN